MTTKIELATGSIEVPLGTHLHKALDLLEKESLVTPSIRFCEKRGPLVGFYLNGEVFGLADTIPATTTVSFDRPCYINTLVGNNIYSRSLIRLFAAAVQKVGVTDSVHVQHTVGSALMYRIPTGKAEEIRKAMHELVEEGHEIRVLTHPRNEAVKILADKHQHHASRLVEGNVAAYGSYVRLDHMDDIVLLHHGPVIHSTTGLKLFSLEELDDRHVLLCYPSTKQPTECWKATDNVNKGLIKMTRDLRDSCHALQVPAPLKSIADVNGVINRGKAHVKSLVTTLELEQESRIHKIAASVEKHHRLIAIAGPSSSGKTSFARKLTTHLQGLGWEPVCLSLDDFYVDRENTPRHPDGSYDFESLYAIDVDFLNVALKTLVEGKEFQPPTFNFVTGKREFHEPSMKLPPNGILVIEGIHGNNPELIKLIPNDVVFRVFISPLTPLVVDEFHPLSTSMNRQIRRMVRDFQFRGYSPSQTFSMWPSVRMGEDKWIFPFQSSELLNATFNSSLAYEWGVLKALASPLLTDMMNPEDPAWSDSRETLQILNLFKSMSDKHVTTYSILREFLGGSSWF